MNFCSHPGDLPQIAICRSCNLIVGVGINGSALWFIVNQNDTFPVPKDCHQTRVHRPFSFCIYPWILLFSPNAHLLAWLVQCGSAPISYPQWLSDLVCLYPACGRASETVSMHQWASLRGCQSECKVPTKIWVFITAAHREWLCVWSTIHILRAAYTQLFHWV